MPPFKDLFGGRNQNAIGTIVKVLDKEFEKDNASFGDWDWDILANEWNNKDLLDWGIDVWQPEEELEKQIDENEFSNQIDTYINAQIKQIVLYYNNEEYETALNNLEDIRLKENLEDNTQVFNLLIEKYLKNEL